MLKVLFVGSGNRLNELSPIVISQGESLRRLDVEVSYFAIMGKGVWGYLRSALRLRAYLQKNRTDLIHVHYALSGWAVVIAQSGVPIILSLMGSDANGDYFESRKVEFKSRYRTLLTYLIQPFVKAIISKSPNINNYVYRQRIANVIPNGVFLDKFQILSKALCRNELGLVQDKQYVLFLGDKNNKLKNYQLVAEAMEYLNCKNLELISPYPISHELVVKYLNASDVFVMSSFMEGSPNVIKEAMACNCPIVATDVGDVRWVLGDTGGCFIATHDPEDFASKINLALQYAENKGRTRGRERIIYLGLDSETIARKIVQLYKKVIRTHSKREEAF